MNQGETHWAAFRRDADADRGTLRELWADPATCDDWTTVLRLAGARYPLTFRRDGETCPLPDDVDDIFALRTQHGCCLTIDLGEGVLVNTHFFEPTAIELDIAPWEISAPIGLEALFTFMRQLADMLDRDVRMTLEGMGGAERRAGQRELAIFVARPRTEEIEHYPVAWGERTEQRGCFIDGVWVPECERDE